MYHHIVNPMVFCFFFCSGNFFGAPTKRGTAWSRAAEAAAPVCQDPVSVSRSVVSLNTNQKNGLNKMNERYHKISEVFLPEIMNSPNCRMARRFLEAPMNLWKQHVELPKVQQDGNAWKPSKVDQFVLLFRPFDHTPHPYQTGRGPGLWPLGPLLASSPGHRSMVLGDVHHHHPRRTTAKQQILGPKDGLLKCVLRLWTF